MCALLGQWVEHFGISKVLRPIIAGLQEDSVSKKARQ